MITNILKSLEMDNQEKKFISSLLLLIPLSLLHSYIRNKTWHVLPVVFLLYNAFGPAETALYISVVLFNYIILRSIKRFTKISVSHIMVCFNLFIIMIYSALEIYYEWDNRFTISGPLMLLTIKMFYAGIEYKESNSFKEFVGYSFYSPGILTGPNPRYNEFIQENQNTKIDYISGILSIIESLLYVFLFCKFKDVYTVDKIIQSSDVFSTMLNTAMLCFICRTKYYFAWSYSNACYIFASNNKMKSIYPLRVEFSTCVRDVTQSWNIYTNKWLKECVFMPLSNNLFVASMATFFVSAFWHGLYPAYYLMFMSIGLIIPIIKTNVKIFKSYGLSYLCYIQMMLVLSYFTLPFFLLDVKLTFTIWKKMYFIGHIYFIISGINHYLFYDKGRLKNK
ncbi:Lysophospholipid acyltransferase [Astathelohania contejeani]|uniref:Lysophospholipid acyltransferase n=1 Tax=Astathelohania contejeani TaxID=164912 RepID=A0ABQ7HZ37_9MICR|nr:Lysophospholipid acyltransferase [Thelohania contejeani]